MIRLKAIKGEMGETEFFLTTATFGEISRMVRYKENEKEWPAELRQQRPLNMSSVRNLMVPYLVENEDHFYSALVVEHIRPGNGDNSVNFIPDTDGSDVGWVEMQGAEMLEALDGQHRLKSIELAVAESPDLARETIGLIIVAHKTVKESQQLFSDLNKNAKPTPKSLNVLFEQREEPALLAKELAAKSKYLTDRVNMVSSGLSARSSYVVSLATLYEAVKIVSSVMGEWDHQQKIDTLVEYWDTALGSLPGFEDIVGGKTTPGQLRAKYVFATGLGFEAIAETIKATVVTHPDNWSEILEEGLPRIDWRLANPDWEGVALFAGRVAIARAARRRTATLVKYLMGLPTEKSHLDDLEEVFSTLKKKLPSPHLIPSTV